MIARFWLDKLNSEPRGWARLVSAGLRLLVAGFLIWYGIFALRVPEGDRDWLASRVLLVVAGVVFQVLAVRTLLRAVREILAGEPPLSPGPFSRHRSRRREMP